MKTQIENSVILTDENLLQKLVVFNELITDVTSAKNEDNLREMMKQHSLYEKYFKFGFGSNHFWLCDKEDKLNKRILFVDFTK